MTDPLATGMNWRHVTIEMLPENTLLEIFDFYRQDSVRRSRGRPWKWHRLAHVCRRWRHVVYTSPRRLGLQILCKSGAPIGHILDSWPTLPLVVRFKGSPKSKFLPNNIDVALRHPDRVYDISIGVTSSIIGSLIEVVQEPFPALKKIEITSKDSTETPVLQVGEAMRRLLLSTNNLVKLWLRNIPKTCYFSPEAIATCLSALAQLKDVYICFHSPASSPTLSRAPPPLERATLPSLLSLAFHGTNEYLEQLVARIDSPALMEASTSPGEEPTGVNAGSATLAFPAANLIGSYPFQPRSSINFLPSSPVCLYLLSRNHFSHQLRKKTSTRHSGWNFFSHSLMYRKFALTMRNSYRALRMLWSARTWLQGYYPV